jgi:hypothetical protein
MSWAVEPNRVLISMEPSGSQSANTAERALA